MTPKPMKRILLTLSIAAAVLLAFAACGPEDEPVDPPVDPTEEEEEIVLRLAPAHDTMFEAGGVMFEMKLVPGGTFTMGATTANGSPCYDPDADIMEQPPHTVTLDAFLMADIEVSQFLYFAVMGSNPSMVSDLALPVHNVSFTNAQRFVDSLSRLTGFRFRLPTEAEWEYAAKGGGLAAERTLFAGSDTSELVAWSQKNADGQVHQSGLLQPNALGLYDMSGNVMEWCTDWYGEYSSSPQTNPQGPEQPGNANLQKRAVRGGSFLQAPYYLRNTARQFFFGSKESQDLGFRVVISVEK